MPNANSKIAREIFGTPDTWTVRPSTYGEFDPKVAEMEFVDYIADQRYEDTIFNQQPVVLEHDIRTCQHCQTVGLVDKPCPSCGRL